VTGGRLGISTGALASIFTIGLTLIFLTGILTFGFILIFGLTIGLTSISYAAAIDYY
jgi:hypothetical protein